MIPPPAPTGAVDDETRALLIGMRRYIIRHQLPMGECVAWSKLKALYGVGLSTTNDEQWLADYRAALAPATQEG